MLEASRWDQIQLFSHIMCNIFLNPIGHDFSRLYFEMRTEPVAFSMPAASCNVSILSTKSQLQVADVSGPSIPYPVILSQCSWRLMCPHGEGDCLRDEGARLQEQELSDWLMNAKLSKLLS